MCLQEYVMKVRHEDRLRSAAQARFARRVKRSAASTSPLIPDTEANRAVYTRFLATVDGTVPATDFMTWLHANDDYASDRLIGDIERWYADHERNPSLAHHDEELVLHECAAIGIRG